MIDLVPPKRWPVFKHKNKDLWVVRDLQGAGHSPWMLTHCRAVAEAWTCRSKELEADLAQAQQQEAIYRAEVVRHGVSDERDGQAKIRVRELEKNAPHSAVSTTTCQSDALSCSDDFHSAR